MEGMSFPQSFKLKDGSNRVFAIKAYRNHEVLLSLSLRDTVKLSVKFCKINRYLNVLPKTKGAIFNKTIFV